MRRGAGGPGRPHALVAGGGIGGLTAALSLRWAGWRVTVLEQATSVGEVGAGIQLAPNGTKILRALGVLDLLDDTAVRPEAFEIRLGPSGRHVASIELAETAERRWGAPYLHSHRADLIDALLRAARRETPWVVLRSGARVVGYEQGIDGVRAVLAHGERVDGDLLVGADGIHSVIRTQLLGPDRPRYTGAVAWRVTVPVARLGEDAPPKTTCIWVGDRRHAVTYRIRGGTMASLSGAVEQDDWQQESWTSRGPRAKALADFAGWHPTVTAILREADALFRRALFDRPRVERWTDGRVALLGDACHPIPPFLGQGATIAIEDAYVLARRLQEESDVPTALRAYAAARRGRAARVLAMAHENVRRLHNGSSLAHAPMRAIASLAPTAFLRRLDWLYGYEAE